MGAEGGGQQKVTTPMMLEDKMADNSSQGASFCGGSTFWVSTTLDLVHTC